VGVVRARCVEFVILRLQSARNGSRTGPMVGRSGRENLWGWADRPTINRPDGWSVGPRKPMGGGRTNQPSATSMVGWSGRDEPMGTARPTNHRVKERRAGVVAIGVRFFVLETPPAISLNQVLWRSVSGADHGSFWNSWKLWKSDGSVECV